MEKNSKTMKNVCMIPVRAGSQRLKRKNYLKINDTHIFELAIIKAIKSKKFDDIYINSEDIKLEKYAKKYKIKFYLREKKLASSNTTSDEVVLDFLNKTKYEKLFWIPPFYVLNFNRIPHIRNCVKK